MKRIHVWLSVVAVLSLLVACTAAPAPTPAPAQPAPVGTTAPAATQAPSVTQAPATKAAEPTASAGASTGGIAREASFGDAVSLNPLLTNDSASSNYQAYVWASLTRRNLEGTSWVGDMYEEAPTLSEDGTTLTWKLRPNLKWSDGQPITAHDVEFTWEKMIDPATKFPAVNFYTESFTDVRAVDDMTVEYSLKNPGFCPAIDNSGLPGPIPKHVYETGDITQNEQNINPSVVSGIWHFKEWQKDDHFSAGPAYADFHRGAAKIDGYTFRVVKDSTVATQLFKTQDIDFLTPDPIDWEEISQLPFVQTFQYYPPGASWTYIGMNMANPLLSDKLVRQAISTAIDKESMIETIRLGFAKVQHSNITASSWAYTDDVPKFPYDPERAKQMLAEAGWTPGPDGILQKDGQQFKIRLFYNAGNKQREQISIITQQNLRDVGIEAEVIAEEWTAYLTRVTESKDMEMFVLGWTGGGDPYSTGNIWRSDGSQNSVGFNNAEVDELYEQGSVVPGCAQEDRKPIYARIQQIIAEEQPYVFLYTNETLLAVNKRVQVNELTNIGATYFPEEWTVTVQAQP
jgi:peptide/nickel transport system substrate-binding protein